MAHRENTPTDRITERDRLDGHDVCRLDFFFVLLIPLADHHHYAVSLAGRHIHATSRTTQSLHSIHNLHIVYGELTVLEPAPVKVRVREYAETIHTLSGGDMKNTGPYLFVLTISLSLARRIVQATQTVLTRRARVILPLLRMQTGQERAAMITPACSMEAIISPHCTSSFAHNINLHQTTLRSRRPI